MIAVLVVIATVTALAVVAAGVAVVSVMMDSCELRQSIRERQEWP